MTKASALIDNNCQLSDVVKKTTDNCSKHTLSKDEVRACDTALAQYADLIDPKFKAWACKSFYRIGAAKFHQFALEARKGRYPSKLFSFLISAWVADNKA